MHCRVREEAGAAVDSGYYAAFSGWLARSQALDVAAGNLANAGTAGYRAERDYFRSAILGPDALNSQLNTTVNAFGVLGGSRLDLGQGALTPTGQSARSGHRRRRLLRDSDKTGNPLHARRAVRACAGWNADDPGRRAGARCARPADPRAGRRDCGGRRMGRSRSMARWPGRIAIIGFRLGAASDGGGRESLRGGGRRPAAARRAGAIHQGVARVLQPGRDSAAVCSWC